MAQGPHRTVLTSDTSLPTAPQLCLSTDTKYHGFVPDSPVSTRKQQPMRDPAVPRQ